MKQIIVFCLALVAIVIYRTNTVTVIDESKPKIQNASDRESLSHNQAAPPFYISFWNRTRPELILGGMGRSVSMRLSYRDNTGKKRSYTFDSNGGLYGAESTEVILYNNYIRIEICAGCSDFTMETWVLYRGISTAWNDHRTYYKIPTNEDSYFYVNEDKHDLIKNNDVWNFEIVNAGSLDPSKVAKPTNDPTKYMWNSAPIVKLPN